MARTASPGGSSTSARRRSPPSRPSGRASRTSPSPGSPDAAAPGPPKLTPANLRSLAARHGILPARSLGQHFLIEPALARRIAQLADVGPGSRVLEIGAGLGSLTVALAGTGARVVAVETDRRLLPALREVVSGLSRVRVVQADALDAGWSQLLDELGPWSMVANLPYNVSVPVIMRALEEEPRLERFLVMIQREVGERLAASPGDRSFGAVSLRVAYRAEARVIRSVSRSVFWPQPGVDSVLVSIVRRPPPVHVIESDLWRVIEVAFGQRRKTIRGALVRMGLARPEADRVLTACDVDPMARPEQLGLSEFACLAGGSAEKSRR